MLAAAAANHADPLIKVTCDRCRANGEAGTDEFADLAELLRFAPVPRKAKRFDGWTPERQQAFIVALAGCGSVRRACHAIGMAQFGAEQLRKADGSDDFNLAWERALDIAEEDRAARLAQGLADARPRGRPPAQRGNFTRPAPAEPELPEPDADPRAEWFDRILDNYVRKLCAERQARLEGRIAAADFALRQITVIELCLELGTVDLLGFLRETRLGHRLTDIADTPATRLLDGIRREHWRLAGEPPRPEPTPGQLLGDHGTHRTYRSEGVSGGPDVDLNKERAKWAEQHRWDAEAHIQWEAHARREYEARAPRPRRTTAQPTLRLDQEPRRAGQPAGGAGQD
ncbi:hypothetical protein [uncultured Sphingomonas sp.]|uniref:hypothetical protein n=1 Tax=uncultured Sphingomonas sp. TaxID=158754 RepID=UPI0025D27064|nr:hypothetical protein [uncultured Sphingomonas sp.]